MKYAILAYGGAGFNLVESHLLKDVSSFDLAKARLIEEASAFTKRVSTPMYLALVENPSLSDLEVKNRILDGTVITQANINFTDYAKKTWWAKFRKKLGL